MRRKVSFEVSKELEKNVFRRVTSVGQRKILAPRDESNLRHDTINNPAELARNGPWSP